MQIRHAILVRWRSPSPRRGMQMSDQCGTETDNPSLVLRWFIASSLHGLCAVWYGIKWWANPRTRRRSDIYRPCQKGYRLVVVTVFSLIALICFTNMISLIEIMTVVHTHSLLAGFVVTINSTCKPTTTAERASDKPLPLFHQMRTSQPHRVCLNFWAFFGGFILRVKPLCGCTRLGAAVDDIKVSQCWLVAHKISIPVSKSVWKS